jgi:hypothetical protein
MDKNLKQILNIHDIQPPKGLKQAVFERIEKEKMKKIARKRLLLRIGFILSGISSVVSLLFFGKDILSSEFLTLVLLGFSDMKTVTMLWQNYALSLMETLPTVSISATLLPVFIFMILLKKYGELENYRQHFSLKN